MCALVCVVTEGPLCRRRYAREYTKLTKNLPPPRTMLRCAADEEGKLVMTQPFVGAMLAAFKEEQLLHRRYAFEIILQARRRCSIRGGTILPLPACTGLAVTCPLDTAARPPNSCLPASCRCPAVTGAVQNAALGRGHRGAGGQRDHCLRRHPRTVSACPVCLPAAAKLSLLPCNALLGSLVTCAHPFLFAGSSTCCISLT